MIEAAAILSAVVNHWSDFVIIMVLLLANAVVGFWEEYQAGNAIAALKAQLAPHARVKRDGVWSDIAARLLVPGDIVRLRLGDIVPADARSLGPDPVEVDQAALTGESLPVSKKGGEVLYSGAILRQGETDALVYATGAHTFFGKTAALVQEAHTVAVTTSRVTPTPTISGAGTRLKAPPSASGEGRPPMPAAGSGHIGSGKTPPIKAWSAAIRQARRRDA